MSVKDVQNLEAWRKELRQVMTQVAVAREVMAQGEVPAEPEWESYRLGDLPGELAEEAQAALLQLEVLRAEIASAMDRNQEERDRLRSSAPKKSDARPIYLDVEG